jgi:phosphoserine/homoserine phosphotransferase
MEGVLVPEIWVEVARRFRLEALKLTTRDVPDYDKLMRYRLGILRKENIRLRDIQRVIGRMQPLSGAKPFLLKLRQAMPVVILSDTYYEFAGPLMEKLDLPVLFCNWLRVDKKGFISPERPRNQNQRGVRLEYFLDSIGGAF